MVAISVFLFPLGLRRGRASSDALFIPLWEQHTCIPIHHYDVVTSIFSYTLSSHKCWTSFAHAYNVCLPGRTMTRRTWYPPDRPISAVHRSWLHSMKSDSHGTRTMKLRRKKWKRSQRSRCQRRLNNPSMGRVTVCNTTWGGIWLAWKFVKLLVHLYWCNPLQLWNIS